MFTQEYDSSEYPQRVGRQKRVLDIDFTFADSRNGARGRGGRGGRGAPRGGAPRGAPRGASSDNAPPVSASFQPEASGVKKLSLSLIL